MISKQSETIVALEKLLASPAFVSAGRQSRFLRYVVERTLAGEAVKESLIGVDVYGRPADYDPKTDSIVRVEAGRLRSRLDAYYAGPGKDDAVRIALPKGGYLCHFEHRLPEPPPATAMDVPRQLSRKWLLVTAAAIVVILAITVVAALLRFEKTSGADRTITIRPFAGAGSDAAARDFARGLTEETASRLANTHRIRVSDAGAPSGRLLEASVQRGKGRIRVVARLVNASDGVYTWSETFERPDGDPERTQKELAGLISVGVARQSAPLRVLNAATLPDYLEAHRLMSEQTGETRAQARTRFERAIDLFQKAVGSQPNSAMVHGGLAQAYLGISDYVPEKFVEFHLKAQESAERALKLDDSFDEPHASLGSALFFGRWDLPGSLSEFTRALEINSRRAATQRLRSDVLCILGRFDEAVAALGAAQTLEPTNVEIAAQKAAVFYRWGKLDQGLVEAGRALAIEPANPYALWVVGLIREQQGRPEEAESTFRKLEFRPARGPLALAHLLASTGRQKEAFELAAKVAHQVHILTGQALVHAGAGDKRAAIDVLERSLRDRDIDLLYVAFDPRFDSLRSEPRFREIMKKVGISLP